MSLFRPMTQEEIEEQINKEMADCSDEDLRAGLHGKNKLPWKEYVKTEEFMRDILESQLAFEAHFKKEND